MYSFQIEKTNQSSGMFSVNTKLSNRENKLFIKHVRQIGVIFTFFDKVKLFTAGGIEAAYQRPLHQPAVEQGQGGRAERHLEACIPVQYWQQGNAECQELFNIGNFVIRNFGILNLIHVPAVRKISCRINHTHKERLKEGTCHKSHITKPRSR